MALEDLFSEDAAEVPEPTNEELSAIAQLATQQRELESQVATLESQLKEAKEQLRKIQEGALPEAMTLVGMLKFTLTDGYTINVRDDVLASIRADYVAQATRWLEAQGLGGVVRDEVKVECGGGERKQAELVLELARKLGVSASEKLFVHPQTLKALVKEQLARGVEFPEEYFSIHPFRKAVIKAPGKG